MLHLNDSETAPGDLGGSVLWGKVRVKTLSPKASALLESSVLGDTCVQGTQGGVITSERVGCPFPTVRNLSHAALSPFALGSLAVAPSKSRCQGTKCIPLSFYVPFHCFLDIPLMVKPVGVYFYIFVCVCSVCPKQVSWEEEAATGPKQVYH